MAVQGDTVVAMSPTSGENACHVFRLNGAELVDRPVTGLPAGAVCKPFSPAAAYGGGDVSSMAVGYAGKTGTTYGILDLEDASVTELPFAGFVTNIRVGKDSVGWYDNAAGVFKVLPRADLGGVPRSVPIAPTADSYVYLVGGHVLTLGSGTGALKSVAPDGTTTTQLPFAYGIRALAGPDGSLIVLGKGDSGDYGVFRFTEGPDGALRRDELYTLPWAPTISAALALSGNRLLTNETTASGNGVSLYERLPALTGVPSVSGGRSLGSAAPVHGEGCADAAACPQFYAGPDGTVAYVTKETAGYVIRVADKSHPSPGRGLMFGDAAPKIYGVSGRYLAYGTGTGATAETDVRDMGTLKKVRTVPGGAAALWGGTLWQLSTTGKVTGTDVATGAVVRTLSTASSCATPSLQASARYLYWECGAVPTAAGVVTLADGKARGLAATTPGRLGDGFLVGLDAANRVTVTDLTGASPTQAVVGTAASTVPGIGFTADPYSSLVAYTGTDGKVHLVPTGTGAAPLTAIDSTVATTTDADHEESPWNPQWWLSKAVGSWTLSFKNKATGVTVQTLTGGEARGLLDVRWYGGASGGEPVPNGMYSWTLTALPADGSGPAMTKTGSLRVTGAGPVLRDYTGDGFGDALTLNTKGEFTFQHGTGTGKFSGKTFAGGWSASSVAVPFGDLNGDHCNDVLIRMPDGSLRGYKLECGAAVTPTTPYTVLGTGFQAYKTLTTAGDLTGDGRADLLGWHAATGDIHLFASKSDGTLAAAKKIRTHWTYTKVMGVGDLNGDGYGDLLATDTSNNLWRYDGTAAGQFKERVLVFENWGSSYDTVVGVGDITGDGKADIIERDKAGKLFRNDGNGKGSFSSRTEIATGWTYKGIF